MKIRALFSGQRPIDRPIEKVIDYAAADDDRLLAEIGEYEATSNVEDAFRKFLDLYGDALDRGQVTEIGVWVSGFYGSGKSSFTKYLGLALDQDRTVKGTPFRTLLAERFSSAPLRAQLATLGTKRRTAVVMLDLGAEQLVESTATPVSTVLYRKVLEWAGYSREKKLAELEFTLERDGKLDAFRQAYKQQFGDDWESVQNQPLVGVSRAAKIVPQFLPKEFPTPESFSGLRFDEALDVSDVAERIVDLIHRRVSADGILLLIDEAGQYVAPRGDLILNLDGFARAIKEQGKGKAWIIATGQQTLAEIVSRAVYNSEELNKLRDRFPISIQLTATDIREITYRRLLTKSSEGESQLRGLLGSSLGSIVTHTRLSGTAIYGRDPDLDGLVRFYPFLPQHFDLLLELVRSLARSTGGIGLRSAIRVIQDLLVDASRSLPKGTDPIAERVVGTLACADDFYDTLRKDVEKVLPHVIAGVERVRAAFPGDILALRIAKAVAVLQVVDNFPRSRHNIAALLYPVVGTRGLQDEVDESISRLVATRECGLIDDPQTGGIGFVSDAIAGLRDKRERYVPTGGEIGAQRTRVLRELFEGGISATLLNIKTVLAGMRYGALANVLDGGEIQFRLEASDAGLLAQRRDELLARTNEPDWKRAIAWLHVPPSEVDERLTEVVRSEVIIKAMAINDTDRDVAQFIRSERNRQDNDRDRCRRLLEASLLAGVFIYRGVAIPAEEKGGSVDSCARAMLAEVAGRVYEKLGLAPLRAATDLAAKFLAVEDLRRMPHDRDPLSLVKTFGGTARVDLKHEVLAETLRVFDERVRDAGAGRLTGSAVMDAFLAPPYGWTKDTTRYIFAALFRAGEIELHTPAGVLKTVGPQALDAFRSTVEFGRVGVGRRNTKPPPEALDRAAIALQAILGEDVLPLEDKVAEAVRTRFPGLIERLGPLPERLRLLGLAGRERAQLVHQSCTDLLSGDAGEAAARLGQMDSNLEGEIRWASTLVRALDEGAEDDIRRATLLLKNVSDIGVTDPQERQTLELDDQIAAIDDALKSELLAEQLPALRGALRTAEERIRAVTTDAESRLERGISRLRSSLEAMPEWPRLSDDDRVDLIKRLDGPMEITRGLDIRSGSQLRSLLGWLARLDRVDSELKKDARARDPEEASRGNARVHLSRRELVPRAVLRQDAIETWIGQIRDRVLKALSSAEEVVVEDDGE